MNEFFCNIKTVNFEEFHWSLFFIKNEIFNVSPPGGKVISLINFHNFLPQVAAIEDFMKMINKNAYILTAVHGTDFITSAKNAFHLIMRNILGVLVLGNVTGMVFFIMQLLISLGATACFVTALNVFYSGLQTTTVLAIIYFIIIFFITMMFFSVFSMAVDTLYLCFCKFICAI